MKPLFRRALIFAFAGTAVLIMSDPKSFWDEVVQTVYVPSRMFNAWHDRLPPPTRPIRKRDLERYPRAGFGIELQDERGFRVDTFIGEATKDMIELPDTTIDLEFSAAQLDTLYDKVIRMRLFEYPGHAPPGYSEYDGGPNWAHMIVRAGFARKELEWTPTYGRPEPLPDDWKRFRDLQMTVARMARAHPAYRALPEAKGIYID